MLGRLLALSSEERRKPLLLERNCNSWRVACGIREQTRRRRKRNSASSSTRIWLTSRRSSTLTRSVLLQRYCPIGPNKNCLAENQRVASGDQRTREAHFQTTCAEEQDRRCRLRRVLQTDSRVEHSVSSARSRQSMSYRSCPVSTKTANYKRRKNAHRNGWSSTIRLRRSKPCSNSSDRAIRPATSIK